VDLDQQVDPTVLLLGSVQRNPEQPALLATQHRGYDDDQAVVDLKLGVEPLEIATVVRETT